MAIPSTNVYLENIYWEAQFGGGSGNPGSGISFGDLAGYSYFDGSNGSGTISYNAWGQESSGGVNRIYGLPIAANPGPYEFNDYKSLVYFYDQSSYQVTLTVINNLAPPPPPPPPINNDVQDCNLSFYDNSGTYLYLAGNSGGVPTFSSFGPTDISQNNTPIIAQGYWYIDLSMDPGFGGGSCDISINGTGYVTGAGIGGGSNLFDWNTYGAAAIANAGSFIGLDVVVTVY